LLRGGGGGGEKNHRSNNRWLGRGVKGGLQGAGESRAQSKIRQQRSTAGQAFSLHLKLIDRLVKNDAVRDSPWVLWTASFEVTPGKGPVTGASRVRLLGGLVPAAFLGSPVYSGKETGEEGTAIFRRRVKIPLRASE